MKKFALTLCIVGTTLALAACASDNHGTYDSGSNYATERTAGDIDKVRTAPVRQERVFRAAQTK